MRRVLTQILLSVAVWAGVVGAAYWWLMQDLAAAQARGDLDTSADSPGLPLVSVALLTAALLLVANLLVLAGRRWRTRRRGRWAAG